MPPRLQALPRVAPLVLALLLSATPALAQRAWVEAKGPNVTVLSDAGVGRARDIAWQFEQVREAMARLFPWARTQLSRPLVVLAARNEATMRALVPEHFERKSNLTLTSMSATGWDRSFVAIRADVRIEDREGINPYANAYWGYASQALAETSSALPAWVRRGLASVISNTLVRDKEIQLGRTLPQHLERLRTRGRITLTELTTVLTNDDPRMSRDDFWVTADAMSWAFVHFLIWGDQGAHREPFDRYLRSVVDGADASTSLSAALGDVSALESAFNVYVSRELFGFFKFETSAKLSREGFPTRDVPDLESSLVRAAFHAAMNRPEDARALVAQAQAQDPAVGDEVLALVAERTNRRDEILARLEKASSQRFVTWYTPFRLATLLPPDGDDASRTRIESLLKDAVALNPAADDAWAMLGQMQADLGRGEAALASATQALLLKPGDSSHLASLALVYRRLGKSGEASKAAGLARARAKTPQERDRAQRVLAALARDAVSAQPGADTAPSADIAATPSPPTTLTGPPVNEAFLATTFTVVKDGQVGGLVDDCFLDPATCRDALPTIAGDCNKGDSLTSAAACRNAGYIVDAGIGVPPAPGLAADFYQKGCAKADQVSCVRLATLQSLGRGVPRDAAAARSVLEPACTAGLQEACFRLGLHLASTKVPADLARARDVLTASCRAGFTESCEALTRLR